MGIKYDFHIHSCLSPCGDNEMTPNNIAGMGMLSGYQVLALTDHNTCKNCPAFFEACRNVGIVPIAGMELTTAEDIHMVCLFPTLESAMEFDAFVDTHRMKIKNRPDIFGDQIIMNAEDEEIGRDEYLLIPATDLDIDTAAREVYARGGAAYPAHVDKQSNGIIAILGDIPPIPQFFAAEFHNPEKIEEYRQRYPILKGLVTVADSDAHRLESMGLEPPEFPLEIDCENEKMVRFSIIATLRGEIR